MVVYPFTQTHLPEAVVQDLRRQNPWWEGRPGRQLPATRRHLVAQIGRRLEQRLAPIVVVRGPRQIGKTTAQEHLIEDFLRDQREPTRILRIQFDELGESAKLDSPILRYVEWFEQNVLQCSLNEAAQAGRPALIFLDEVQNLDNWASQLKFLVDQSTVQIVVTGSSALRIEAGRDSLAGRISTLEAGTLSLTEIAAVRGGPRLPPFLADNGLEPLLRPGFWRDLAAHGREHRDAMRPMFQAFSERGGYPLGHLRADAPWPLVADQLNETVIRRVIQHDLRVGERGRKRDPSLLEELFRLACRNAGQATSVSTFVRDIQLTTGGNVGVQRVQQYLKFLGDTLLLRLVPPAEIRLQRGRTSPKICLSDHGLRSSWLQENISLVPEELALLDEAASRLAGPLAESVVGALLCTVNGLDVAHLPARGGRPEVNFLLNVGSHRIPIEVKYRRRVADGDDTLGLRTFLNQPANEAPFGLLITRDETFQSADPRILTVSLPSFLLLR